MRHKGKLVILVLALLAVAFPAAASHRFADVGDDHIFHADIAWLVDSGITTGCDASGTNFCPEADVTRGQLAALLRRANDHVLDQTAANQPGALAAQLAAANLATAAFQDVPKAEKAGYLSTIDSLACHENPGVGGMGVHYLNEALLDDVVDVTQPEALVYELDADGNIAGLVAHEYVVPIDAWSSSEPPMLFNQPFTPHPVLPLWKLHAWVWKDNPNGMFADWNPKVRMCPDGVPVFGEE